MIPNILVVFCYSIALILSLHWFFRSKSWGKTASVYLISLGVIIQICDIFSVSVELEGLSSILNILALFFAIGILAARVIFKSSGIVIFTLPFVVILLLLGLIPLKGPDSLKESYSNPWFLIHIFSYLLAYVALFLATGSAIMYLMQEKFIKDKNFGPISHNLPSLEKLDKMNYKLLAFGFTFLTIGLVCGAVFAKISWGNYLVKDSKIIWAIITWLVYAVVIHVRLTSSLRGKKVAILSIVGMCFILLTFIWSDFITGGPHSFLK